MLGADGVGDELRKAGVALQQPATGSDTVGDVGEVVTALELDKVAEDGRLEELRVELGNTVDLEGGNTREVGHADVLGLALCTLVGF